ncbi:spore germination protein [Bacillaceae bacterium C204]|uniref:spore germination protein n=1 Tax=Neobacillus sp. 204 TaxID=3383351 RepID=UPI0039786535
MAFRRKIKTLKSQKEEWIRHNQQESEEEQNKELEALSSDVFENETVLKSTFSDCPDVIFRRFLIGNETKAFLIYTEGLANIEELDKNVLSPLMQQDTARLTDIQAILEQKLSVSKVNPVNTIKQAIQEISSGNPVILIDQQTHGITLGLAKWEKRAIEEPVAESVVRGPRDGFTETLSVNITLLRRKIKSPDLKMKSLTVGRYSQTQIVYMYIEGIVDHHLLDEVHNRLSRIDIDGVLESGYIEEFIEDYPFSPFPQILNTERPDVAASSLLEGRVVIIVDGTPFVLIAPTTLYSLFQASEDYYQRFMIGTLIRWLRYIFILIALLLPSSYVAILTYHQEMLPTTLLLSVAQSREQVPFPALIEAIIMELTFEAIREAGIRLPKQVGSAVSIVGALVIGQAAVSSGLVSAPMVMVVAITGIASFAIPRYNASTAIRMLRFPMMVAAGTLGLLGIMLGILTIIVHLNTVRSFGVPYLSSLAPMKGEEMKDVLIRAPWWSLRKRPRLTGYSNTNRQQEGQKPDPLKGTE